MSMSEDYDYFFHDTEYHNHNDLRLEEWTMRNKSTIAIGSMIDSHLLNAYKKTGDERLFKEMVVRLFEQRVARMTV
jgi:hypothetical protein